MIGMLSRLSRMRRSLNFERDWSLKFMVNVVIVFGVLLMACH